MDLAVRGTAKMTGDGFRHAPIHIVILGDPRVKDSYPIRTKLEKAESHFVTGLANATLLIHLAAASLGLASQYVSDANSPYMETMLKVLLKIPEPLRIYHLVPVGYAKSQVAAPPPKTARRVGSLRELRDDKIPRRSSNGKVCQNSDAAGELRKGTVRIGRPQGIAPTNDYATNISLLQQNEARPSIPEPGLREK